jgi:hypothetical protein
MGRSRIGTRSLSSICTATTKQQRCRLVRRGVRQNGAVGIPAEAVSCLLLSAGRPKTPFNSRLGSITRRATNCRRAHRANHRGQSRPGRVQLCGVELGLASCGGHTTSHRPSGGGLGWQSPGQTPNSTDGCAVNAELCLLLRTSRGASVCHVRIATRATILWFNDIGLDDPLHTTT